MNFVSSTARRGALILALACLACLGTTTAASALDCWEITGWIPSPTDPQNFERALITSTSCTTVPDGTAWLEPMNNAGDWVRIDLSDPHVDGFEFVPLLVYSGDDASGFPQFDTSILVCTGCPNRMPLYPYPPEQGAPAAASRVKLRHRQTNQCILTGFSNGGTATNGTCWSANAIFQLDKGGNGTYRLRNELAGQCLYAQPNNGQSVHHWVCWNDPNMRFELIAQSGGYRLRHVSFNQCIFGNPTSGGTVHTWACWSDPNMVYQVDIINY